MTEIVLDWNPGILQLIAFLNQFYQRLVKIHFSCRFKTAFFSEQLSSFQLNKRRTCKSVWWCFLRCKQWDNNKFILKGWPIWYLGKAFHCMIGTLPFVLCSPPHHWPGEGWCRIAIFSLFHCHKKPSIRSRHPMTSALLELREYKNTRQTNASLVLNDNQNLHEVSTQTLHVVLWQHRDRTEALRLCWKPYSKLSPIDGIFRDPILPERFIPWCCMP